MEYEYGPHLERQDGSPHPLKTRRGSKIISVLRALTNSGISTIRSAKVSGGSSERPPQIPLPVGLNTKLSVGYLMGQQEPTVVHRGSAQTRPSLMSFSLEKAINETAEPSLGNTNSTSTTSSISSPRLGNSTGKTSLDSKMSPKSKIGSHTSSDTKNTRKQRTPEKGSESLAPIAEVEIMDVSAPQAVPTVVTVENASAAKIYFETHYNILTSSDLSGRSVRRRQLEGALYDDTFTTIVEREELRRILAERETNHLRESRVIKSQAIKARKGCDITSSKWDIIRVLGKGSFGVVRLVREKGETLEKAKEIYAMKVIRKSDMLRNSQEGHLRAERDFLVAAEGSRWVVPLIASFQDLNNLYLVMDYMPGGDFLGLLIRDNVLSEPVAKWYIAEMILCVEEAHSLRWIHRDVKPDNFLISASGHLKISDFGLAFDGHWSHDQSYYNNHRYSLLTKLGINVDGDTIDRKEGKSFVAALKNVQAGLDRHRWRSSEASEGEGVLNWRNRHSNRTHARSVVGTSQYMAPEVVKGESYDARCDWWSVAVILYECIYGHTPFLAEEGGRQQTKQNIVDHKLTFSFPKRPQVSKRCQDLIQCIIRDKEHRLCSKRYQDQDANFPLSPGALGRLNRDYSGRYVFPNDAEDIKAHKWFRDVDWDHLHLMTPPFVPDIKSTDDTHYFDEEDPISDFSESKGDQAPATIEEIAAALKPFNREIQMLAADYIERPHDSVRLRKIEKEIDAFNVNDEQKGYLKDFVRHYGPKEKKRPRDRLLRDRETAPKVLELRKRGAFLGYTYKRIRKENAPRVGLHGIVCGSTHKTAWHRSRLSVG